MEVAGALRVRWGSRWARGPVAIALACGTMALAPSHPIHMSYGRLVVEGRTVTLRLRMFRDDLEQALGQFGGAPVTLASDSRTALLFGRYVNDRVFVAADGRRLIGAVVAGGEDELMWWFEVRFDAPATVRALRVGNGILFDRYADQRNIVKVVHFPSERQFALSFTARDTEPRTIAFPVK